MRELTTQELDLVAGGSDIESNHARQKFSVKVYSDVDLSGNYANAEAYASGRNTLALTNAEVGRGYSSATSVAASSSGY